MLIFCLKLIPSAGLLLIFLISAFGWGYSLLSIIRLRNLPRNETLLYSTILGMGVIGHLVLLSGLGKLLYPLTAIILLILGIGLAIFHAWNHRTTPIRFSLPAPLQIRNNWFQAVLVVIIFINLGFSFVTNVLTPPISVDEVAYHMAVPKLYVNHHSVYYLATIPHSNWPFETEMLFTLGLLLSSEILAHSVTWVSLIFICFVLFLFGRKYFDGKAGLIAGAIFSSTPLVITLTGTGLIELPLTMYILLATITAIDWFLSSDHSYFVLSALFAGLAASTKLNAALIPVILGLCIVFHSLLTKKQAPLKVIKQFSLYGFIAFIVVAPWYLKTWIQTGNPFWPYFWNILGGKNWDNLGSQNLFGFIQSPNMPMNIKNWLTGFWVITAHPNYYGSTGYELSWVYLILIPIPILALIWLKSPHRRVFVWLSVLALIYYTNWFLQTHQTRFLMPTIGVLAFVIGIGLSWLFGIRGWIWNAFWSLAFIGVLLSTNWVLKPANRQQVLNNWPYLSGEISRDQFLEEHNDGYKVFEHINTNIPKDDILWLALYEVRGYYLNQDYLWANPISQRAIPLEQYQNAGQLANELNKRGISYILLNTSTIDTYSYIKYGELYSRLIRSLVAEHGQILYADMGEELYKLVEK